MSVSLIVAVVEFDDFLDSSMGMPILVFPPRPVRDSAFKIELVMASSVASIVAEKSATAVVRGESR